MKIIRNNIIPFKGFKAINLFGVLFVRNGATMSDTDLNHEEIHSAQMREMLFIFFYVWYLLEWLFLLLKHKNATEAYRNISLEREAYENMYNESYLKNRKPFNWIR